MRIAKTELKAALVLIAEHLDYVKKEAKDLGINASDVDLPDLGKEFTVRASIKSDSDSYYGKYVINYKPVEKPCR